MLFISNEKLDRMLRNLNEPKKDDREYRAIAEQLLISEIAIGVTERLNNWVDTPYAENITPQQDIERVALEIADYVVWKTSKNR